MRKVYVIISINGKETPAFNNELFQFKRDGTFVFGEYGATPLNDRLLKTNAV